MSLREQEIQLHEIMIIIIKENKNQTQIQIV